MRPGSGIKPPSGPVDYCFSPGISPAAGSLVFSGGLPVASYFTACYRYALSRGWKRLAFLVTTDAGGQLDEDLAQKELLKPEFSNSGITIVANERYNINDISVAAQLARIKAAAEGMAG